MLVEAVDGLDNGAVPFHANAFVEGFAQCFIAHQDRLRKPFFLYLKQQLLSNRATNSAHDAFCRAPRVTAMRMQAIALLAKLSHKMHADDTRLPFRIHPKFPP